MSRYIIIFLFLNIVFLKGSYAQCSTTVDFNNWVQAGDPDNGDWQILNGGSELYQTINGQPTFYVTQYDLLNVEIQGKFLLEDDGDNDFVGFVFGFRSPLSSPWDEYDTWLFDWKKDGNSGSNDWHSGFSLDSISGTVTAAQQGSAFWEHQDVGGFHLIDSLVGAGLGWEYNTEYSFKLIYTATKIIIIVDGDTIFQRVGCYVPGRFGFYNYSQSHVRYYDFSYKMITNFEFATNTFCVSDSIPMVVVNDLCSTSVSDLNIASMHWDFGDGNTYTNNNVTDNNINVQHLYPNEGDYVVTLIVEDNQGCSDTVSKPLHVNDLPQMNVSDTAICKYDAATIVANPNNTYLWSTGDATTSITVTPTVTTTYYAYFTDNTTGCANMDSVTVTVYDLPVIDLGNDTTVCYGSQIDLDATHPNILSYLWSTGENSAAISDVPDVSTTYSVTLTDNHTCHYTDSLRVNVVPDIQIDFSGDTLLCYNSCDGMLQALVTGGTGLYEYSWSSGATTATITNLCPAVYSLTVTDSYGCQKSDSTVIGEMPEIVITPTIDSIYCHDSCTGAISIFATGFPSSYQYLWNTGDTTYEIQNICSGDYSVTVSDTMGCHNVAYIHMPNPAPIVLSLTGDTMACGHTREIDAIVQNGTFPYQYFWGSQPGGSHEVFDIYQDTIVHASVVDAHGCTDSASIELHASPPIELLINTDRDTVCVGETINIEGNVVGGTPPYNYSLMHPGTDVFSSFPYAYSVFSGNNEIVIRAIDQCGVVDYDTLTIYGYQMPNISFSSDIIRGCEPLTVNFIEMDSIEWVAYQWDFGDNGSADERNPSHTYREVGVYDVSLTVTSQYGCTTTRTISQMIEVFPNPVALFDCSPRIVPVIKPEVVFYNLSQGSDYYIWSFGDGDTVSVSEPIHLFPPQEGTYQVSLIAITEHGCADTIRKNVYVENVVTLWVPTAFSPNGDGVNDLFYPTGVDLDEKDFHFYVYDRWGGIVFEHHGYDPSNPEAGAWDGTVRGKSFALPGVYIWRCIYKGKTSGESYIKTGHVTLIR